MSRCLWSLTFVASLACTAPGVAAPGVLDLIPDDANAALVIRSIKDLKNKGDRFLADADMKLGLRPTEAVDYVYAYLGIRAGVDEDEPAGLVLVDEKYGEKDGDLGVNASDLESRLVLLVPFSDRAKIAANFKLKPGALQGDKVLKVDVGMRGTPAFVAIRDRHLLIGFRKEAVRSVAQSKPLVKILAAERARALESADLLLFVSPHGDLGKEWKRSLNEEEKRLDKERLDIDPDVRQPFFETMASLQFFFMTVRIDDGLHLGTLTTFPKEMPEAARQFLKRLEGGAGASGLAGLPDRSVVAAQAACGDGAQHTFVLKMLFHYLARGTALERRVPFWADSLDPSQRLTVVGVVTEAWNKLHGHRAAIYRNAEPTKQGLFSVVAILDTDDAGKFLGEVKQLARFAGSAPIDLSDNSAAKDDVQLVKRLIQDLDDRQFLVRQTAGTKLELIGEPAAPYLDELLKSKPALEVLRRAEAIQARIAAAVAERRKGLFSDVSRRLQPSFSYLVQADKQLGFPVDVLRIKLSDRDIPAARQFELLFGPDWDKVRVAVYGKQVVLLWGSDPKLLAETLRNLKESRPGLAQAKQFAAFAGGAEPGRKIECHASLRTLIGLARADDLKEGLPASPPLLSLVLAVHADRIQCDLHLPVSEIKFLSREANQNQARPPDQSQIK